MSAKKLLLALTISFILLKSIPVHAQEDFYYVYDAGDPDTLLASFETYGAAASYFDETRDGYDNLLISYQDRIVRMEYGSVEFRTNEACSINIGYHSRYRDEDDYLNGCFGIDGAYIDTSSSGKSVYFMISDDYGQTDIENVELKPYADDKKLSVYAIRNGSLIHNIRTQSSIDYYTYSLILDQRPSFLEEGQAYYSYDGHYFYDDFGKMIDDYRNGERTRALNEEAYFNYFQFLPHRSMTAYSQEELEHYFQGILGLDGRLFHYLDVNMDNASDEVNRSQLHGQIGEFLADQDLYGANALMMLASAINESAYGKSGNAFAANNLFTNAAYESDAERNSGRYADIASSIYSHAKYFISSLYSNHLRASYSGTFFGNKSSGINVNYSLDTYYGEKNAALCHELDAAMGSKDADRYALAIIQDRDRLRFYTDEELSDLQFSIDDVHELSFVILGESEDSYKVQIDHSFSDDYLYDFTKSVAYISKDAVSAVLNEDMIGEPEYEEKQYDLAGGTYHDYGNLKIRYLKGSEVTVVPEKEGYEFVSYDENGTAAYRAIKDIRLIENGEADLEYGRQPDLSCWDLEVTYDDLSKRTIPVDTDMVGAYDIHDEKEQTLTISYCGKSVEKKVVFSKEKAKIRERISDALARKDYQTIKADIGKIAYPLTFAQIREIDFNLKQADDRNYVIDDQRKRYNFSISGLDLSLKDYDSFRLIDDTYYIILKDIAEKDRKQIYELAQGYGFEEVEGIDISFRFNYQDISLEGPAIVQIGIEDKRNDLVYSVYHLNERGDIIKCRTTQSDNFIQFMIDEEGPYLVLSKQSENEYLIADKIEDLSYENMGYDSHHVNLLVMAILVFTLAGLIGITVYYIIYNKRKRLWKDFKKLLPTQDFVQEEKPKN